MTPPCRTPRETGNASDWTSFQLTLNHWVWYHVSRKQTTQVPFSATSLKAKAKYGQQCQKPWRHQQSSNNDKVETEFHFVMECSKLQNLQNELFFIITKKGHTFMHLNIIDKFLYILRSEINTCTIAKFINIKCMNYIVVFYITLNLIFCDFTSFTYIFTIPVTNKS